MYGCSTAATLAASSSSSADIESDLVDSVRERVAELSGSDSTSSMDPSDVDEDPGYRVSNLQPIVVKLLFFLWSIRILYCWSAKQVRSRDFNCFLGNFSKRNFPGVFPSFEQNLSTV